MKKLLFVLILTLGWLVSNGQTGPVFPYTHPSKQTLQELALSEAVKGYTFRSYLVKQINLGLRDTACRVSSANVISIFEHLFLEEVYLTEGSYTNSGYDPLRREMDPSVGHEWTGFAWVFRLGTYAITIIKEDCGNILIVPVIRRIVFVPQPRPEPNLTPNWRTYQAPKKVYPFNPPPMPVVVTTVFRQRTWVGKHIVPLVIGFVVTSTTIYLVANNNHHHETPAVVIEPRTMPPGIPAVPATPTPGVPSDPRNQPGGVGMRFEKNVEMKFNSFNTTDHAIVVFRFGH